MTNNVLLEFLGKNGAGVYFTLEMAQALVNNGKNVYVLLSSGIMNRQTWLDAQKRMDKLNLLFIETGNKKTIAVKTLGLFFSRNCLLEPIRDIEFDCAIRTFPHPWMEFIEACLTVKRVAFILHDPIPHTGTQWYRRVIAKRNVRTATDIIVMSQHFVDVVCQRYGVDRSSVHYMKHGILHMQKYASAANMAGTETLRDKDVVFLFFGRIDKYKGLKVLAAAYGDIEQAYPCRTALVVAGCGDFSDYRALYDSLKSALVFNRYIKDEEIDALFSTPNAVVVLPYLDATQSGVITVAADYLCPIIASDSGGLREQLDDGKVGVLVKPGDVDALTRAMKTFVTDDDAYRAEREKMVAFKASLGWDVIVRKLLDEFGCSYEA